MKNVRRGGFTLAELLIVMAIVVVLAAVAMPSFAKQLETARETNDLEVIRGAYVDAFTDAMKDIQNTGTVSGGGAYPITGLSLRQQSAGFEYITGKVAGTTVSGDTISTHTKATFTFSVSSGGGGLTLDSIVTAVS